MKKKLISLLLSLIVILSFSISSIYADTNNKGKVIYLSLNRTFTWDTDNKRKDFK